MRYATVEAAPASKAAHSQRGRCPQITEQISGWHAPRAATNCAPTSLRRRTTTRRMTPKSKVRLDTRLNALAFADEPAFSVHRKLPRPTRQNMYEGTNQMTKDEKWHEPPTEPAGRCTGLFFVLSGPTRPHTLHGAHKHPGKAPPPGSPFPRNHKRHKKCSAG